MDSVPAPPARRHRARPVLVALATPFLLLGAPSAMAADSAGIGQTDAAFSPTTPGPTITAIQELVEDGTVSDELSEALGYHPEERDGFATDPAGACSSPVELPASFDIACQTHDLGYDLLRAAEEAGETIPPELRSQLDQQFYQRISDTCTGPTCEAAALVTRIAVSANTLRQGGGAPVAEEWPWSDW